MLRTKKCPVCGGGEIYTNRDKAVKGSERYQIPLTVFRSMEMFSIVCLDCGYTEDHVDVEKEGMREDIRKHWKRAD